MLRIRTLPVWLVALAAWAGAPPAASALPPFGIPIAGGIPGDSGPPDWLSGAKPYGNKIDDPRWVGSAGTSYGVGSDQPMASFQACGWC